MTSGDGNGSEPGTAYDGADAGRLYARFGDQFPSIEIDPAALAESIRQGTPYRAFPTGFAERVDKVEGHDGSVIIAGLLDTLDHNANLDQEDWLGEQFNLGIVDKMRREDPGVAAGVFTWSLAIQSAAWRVEPPEDPTPLEEEQAAFVWSCLTEHLRGGLHGFIEQAASFVWRGVMWFEIVFRHDEALGRNVIDRLAPRLPWSIEKIVREEDGRYGLVQAAPIGDGDDWSAAPVHIPAQKLLHLVFNPDGDAPIGVSILRACHAAYRLRRQFTKLAGAGYERSALGIPYVEVDPRVPRGSETQVDTLLRELRSGARKHLALPPGFTLKFAEFPMRTQDLREDRMEAGRDMARAMLVPHIYSESGALAGSHIQGQMDAFETAVQAAAEYIGRTLSDGPHAIIKRLVDHNWTGTSRYPRLVPGIIRVGDFSRLLTAAKDMAGAGLVEKNRDVQARVHELLGFPPPEEKMEEPEADEEASQEETQPVAPPEAPRTAGGGSGAEEAGDEQEANEDEGKEVRVAASAIPYVDRYSIPGGVRESAQRALDWKQKYRGEIKGGTETGWRRAGQLARSNDVAAEDIVTIAAWWARHETNARSVSDEFKGQPWKDAGYVAGLLWGGTPGQRWATSIRKGLSCGCDDDPGPTAFADIGFRFDMDAPTQGPRGRDLHPLEQCVRLSETRGRVESDTEEQVRAIERFRKALAPKFAETMVQAGTLAKAQAVTVPGVGRLAADLEATLRRTYRAGGEAVEAEVERLERDPDLQGTIEEGTFDRGEEGEMDGERVYTDRHPWARLAGLLGGDSWQGVALAPRRSKGRLKKPKPDAPGTSATDDIDPEDAVKAIASTTAKGVAARMTNEALVLFQALAIGGTLPKAEFATASERIAERLATLPVAPDRRQAAKDTRSIYGLARAQKGRSMGDMKEGMFSNLLESSTCGPCEAQDLRTFPLSRYDEFATPYADCLGGDLCNCLVIFVPKG